MKKIYLSLFSLSFVFASVAQNNMNSTTELRKDIGISNGKITNHDVREKGQTLWTNDFSNPADWTFQDNGSNPAANWVITTDVNAIPYSGLAPAGHTSAANGYALIDSDTPGNAATQNVDITLAAGVDLTGANQVNLVFEHSYRIYGDVRTVQVSNDGGTTWTDYVITDGTGSGDTGNPDVVSLNISAVAGNQANVTIRFHYEGAWGWFWAIDDVAIIETDDHDLVLTSATFESLGLPYYKVPTAQVSAFDLYGVADNIGLQDQTNSVLSVDVDGAAFATSTPVTIPSGTVGDTLVISAQWTPAASVASHTIDFNLSSDFTDADPSNNTASIAMEVTENIYARDNGNVTGGSFNSGNAYEIGNYFDIFADQTIYSINVGIHTACEAGAIIYATIYSIDAATGDFIFEGNTDDYTVDASDIDAEVTLDLFSPFNMLAGNGYLVVVGAYGNGGASNDLVVSRAGASAAQTSFFYDGTDLTWYYTTNTPWVRMNTLDATGVAEASLEGVSLFPNPTEGILNITNENNTQNTIVVYNVLGKVVMTTTTNTTSTVDLSANGSGVYLVEVSNTNGKITERVILK